MTKADLFGFVGVTIEGKFRVDEVVGEGGFGVVYRGHHLGFDEPVAVKCLKLPASNPRRRARAFPQDVLGRGAPPSPLVARDGGDRPSSRRRRHHVTHRRVDAVSGARVASRHAARCGARFAPGREGSHTHARRSDRSAHACRARSRRRARTRRRSPRRQAGEPLHRRDWR